jgi:hypothetical protein
VEALVARFRARSPFSLDGNVLMDNLRPGGALRWKLETASWKGREWYVVSRYLQGCSSRLCRLRINGLTPASKY